MKIYKIYSRKCKEKIGNKIIEKRLIKFHKKQFEEILNKSNKMCE